MLPSNLSKSSPNILEWVLVTLMAVTLAGVGYLYLTLTQLSDSVMATNADVITMKSEVMAQKEAMVEGGTERSEYRILAKDRSDTVRLIGKGICPAVYSVSEPRYLDSAPGELEAKDGLEEYNFGYRQATVVPEAQDLGSIVIRHVGTWPMGIIDSLHFAAIANLPECQVTAILNEH